LARLRANLSGRHLAILGYGRIGRAVAERARAFGMRVAGIRRDPLASAGEPLEFVGGFDILDRVLDWTDHLVVALPLTPQTRGILGARELGLLKPTALLVNVGRGEAIDEDALYEALAGRRIAGAALDVWYRYPAGAGPALPSRRPFQDLPNVLMTPHVSGWTAATLDGRAALVADNIARTSRGEAPLNLIAAPG
jgi:phosphoglycerate dehydrogenase-like enzyme